MRDLPIRFVFEMLAALGLLCFPSLASSQMPVEAVPNQYIIKFGENAFNTIRALAPEAARYTDEALREAVNSGLGVTQKASTAAHVELTELLPGETFDRRYAESLLDRGIIEFAEPNYIVAPSIVPDDPEFSKLWGLSNSSAPVLDIDAPEAWALTTGNSAQVVAVVDTGIDFNHPDLAPNVWTNEAEIPANGVDDDQNGYVDDVHGFNTWDNNGDVTDHHSHGTHVAGTIGAVGSNGLGVAGVNWEVRLMALRFLGGPGGTGTTWGAINAIEYAVAMKKRGVNIIVLNNSWGGGGYSYALESVIRRANSEQMLFVAAAGNSSLNSDNTPYYPAAYEVPNVISVAALSTSGSLSSFSNYGALSVDLAAPGQGIYSTVLSGSYANFSGTSMAAPHVSGVAALVASYRPILTAAQMRQVLLGTVRTLPGLQGKTATGGLVNAYSALTGGPNLAPVLVQPQDITVSYAQRTIEVQLQAADPEGDSLMFSARLLSDEAGSLDQLYSFSRYVYFNLWGYEEKWLLGAENFFYVIMPDGSLYRYANNRLEFLTRTDTLFYFEPEALVNASSRPSPAQISISGSRLVISPREGVLGGFGVRATVTDGSSTDSKSFLITVVDNPPELAPIDDRSMQWTEGEIRIDLSSSDPDGDSVSYGVEVRSAAAAGYALDQHYRLGPSQDCDLRDNLKGLGEKYFTGSTDGTRTTFSISPGGELRRWDGQLSQSTLVAILPREYYEDPNLLTDAEAGGSLSAQATVENNVLVVRPTPGQSGILIVTVTASDGRSSSSRTFFIRVGDQAPVLPVIADQTMPSGQNSLTIPVGASDADGDSVFCRVEIQDWAVTAAQLQTLHQFIDGAASGWRFNMHGLQEKNLDGYAPGTQTRYSYYILPSGELRLWKGSAGASPVVEYLDSRFYAHPELLTGAEMPAAPLLLSGACTPETLSLSRDPAVRGFARVSVTVSDNVKETTKRFTVELK